MKQRNKAKYSLEKWSQNITKTCLYNFDSLKPHMYIVKLGFTGVYVIFLISAQKHRLWVLVRTVSPRRFWLQKFCYLKIYILEYADVVWDNCTLYEVNTLEKIQLEAARIVTGTTKLVSLEMLYKETGWETLEVRRSKHKLCLFYKMSNNISPEYLSSLVP